MCVCECTCTYVNLCVFISRPGRRPLGFLSLLCPKNSLESDEVTQTHSKKRLKPQIPVSRRNLRKPNLHNTSQKKNQDSSAPPPSPSVTAPLSGTAGSPESSAAQVCEHCCVLLCMRYIYHLNEGRKSKFIFR